MVVKQIVKNIKLAIQNGRENRKEYFSYPEITLPRRFLGWQHIVRFRLGGEISPGLWMVRNNLIEKILFGLFTWPRETGGWSEYQGIFWILARIHTTAYWW